MPQVVSILLKALEAGERPSVDLYTGRRCTAVDRSKFVDVNGHGWPHPVRGALEVLDYGLADFEALRTFLRRAREQVRVLEQAYDQAPAKPRAEARRELDRAQGRYLNDLRCFLNVASQEPEQEQATGIASYRLAYAVRSTGRIGQVGGGLQNASRAMKYAAYSSVPDVRNYDLKSAHAYILLQLCEEADIECDWIRRYLEEPALAESYCEYVGIPKQLWKRVFFGLVNGGYLPIRKPSDRNSIVNEIRKYVAEDDVYGVVQRAREVTEPLRTITYALCEHFIRWVENTAESCRGGRYVRNDAGMLFYPDELRSAYVRRKRLTAFFLQGKEAAFIHNLTILSRIFGFRVISNEHDGVVTIGKVPEEAIAIAGDEARFKYANLREKPIWEPDERNSWRRSVLRTP